MTILLSLQTIRYSFHLFYYSKYKVENAIVKSFILIDKDSIAYSIGLRSILIMSIV